MKTIDYKNYEWIIIEEDEEKIKLLKKDAIENSCVNFDGIDDKLADFKEELGDIENIDILSVEDIVKMDLDIIICSQSYWTDSKVKNSSYVWAVDSTGYLTHWNSAYISLVVRPVITILKSKLYQNKKINKLPFYDYSDILDKIRTKDECFEKRLEKVEKRLDDYHNKINEMIELLNTSEKR